MRFVSRRHRTEVIQARRNLKGTGIAIVEDLIPLNEERPDRVSQHEAVKNTCTKDGKIFTLLTDKSVVKVEKGDLSKLPRALSDPHPAVRRLITTTTVNAGATTTPGMCPVHPAHQLQQTEVSLSNVKEPHSDSEATPPPAVPSTP